MLFAAQIWEAAQNCFKVLLSVAESCVFSLSPMLTAGPAWGAAVAGTGRIGESATDRFPPAATGAVCLFSYLSSAVNQEERWRERWDLQNKTTKQEKQDVWRTSKPQQCLLDCQREREGEIYEQIQSNTSDICQRVLITKFNAKSSAVQLLLFFVRIDSTTFNFSDN